MTSPANRLACSGRRRPRPRPRHWPRRSPWHGGTSARCRFTPARRRTGRRASNRRADRVQSMDRRWNRPVPLFPDLHQCRIGTIRDHPAGHAMAMPVGEQRQHILVVHGRLPDLPGGFPAVELKHGRPEPPDTLQCRAVGIEKNRDPPGAAQRNQARCKHRVSRAMGSTPRASVPRPQVATVPAARGR